MGRIAAFAIVTALAAAVHGGSGGPVFADSCYGGQQIRQMVQQGQIIALSSVIGQINAIGQPVSSPELCGSGDAMYYQVDVVKGGAVVHLRVDARSGAISQ